MLVLNTGVLPRAHDTQGLCDCAFARRANGATKQDLHVLEHWRGAQRRTGSQQGDKLAGHTQPPLTFLGGNHQELMCPAFFFQRSAMDKVELKT